MTKLEGYWAAGLAAGGGAIAVLLLVGHSMAVSNASAPSTVPDPATIPPNHVDMPNFPPINLGNITIQNNPPAAAPGCDCGCQQSPFLGQFQQLVDEYDTGIHNLMTNFTDALIASVPLYNGGTFNPGVSANAFLGQY
jgi:hypothetical protein